MALIATPTLTISNLGDVNLVPAIIVDWDNDGSFDSDEEITSYVTAFNWTRGKEPEQAATPVGTAVIQVNDPTAVFTANSTFWGVNGTVAPGRGVRATITFDGSTYIVFRGVIHRFTHQFRPGNNQKVTIFCTDEMEQLSQRLISNQNTDITTVSTPTEDRPITGRTFGDAGDGSTSIVDMILNDAGWPSGRRITSETGSTAEFWWVYKEKAKAALDEIERHEGKRSTIFIDTSGSVVFYSSTHNNGTTHIAQFGTGDSGVPFQQFSGELSARNVVNRSIVSVFPREAGAFKSVQEIAFPRVDIIENDTYSWIVDLDNAPVNGVFGITAQKDSTAGMAIIGQTSGTSYETSSHEDMVKYQVLGGGSAIQYFITNIDTGEFSGESLRVAHPEVGNYSGSTDAFPQLRARLTPIEFTSTFADPTSTGIYGSREVTAEYPFYGVQGKAAVKASEDVSNNSTAHMDGINLHIIGTDSDSVRQVLTRGIFDRIRVNSTELNLKHVAASGTTFDYGEFYITKGEWQLDPGGIITAIWSLDEATGQPAE